ncbi:hypothetical protein CHELA40_10483 [Chelatococcus asaccharovorans]|nr:hypothetical protein CHELA40_10483 [Chelatococcus asaccharovorans]CAH1686646.1 hypothetical protein CHELA17_65123 [Chelatococcus asaccharovorans]
MPKFCADPKHSPIVRDPLVFLIGLVGYAPCRPLSIDGAERFLVSFSPMEFVFSAPKAYPKQH